MSPWSQRGLPSWTHWTSVASVHVLYIRKEWVFEWMCDACARTRVGGWVNIGVSAYGVMWVWIVIKCVYPSRFQACKSSCFSSIDPLPFHTLSPVPPGGETSVSFEISPRNAEMRSRNISVTFLCRELKAEGQAQVHISPAWRTHSLQVSTASISTSRNNNWNYHPLRRIYCSVLNTCCTCP